MDDLTVFISKVGRRYQPQMPSVEDEYGEGGTTNEHQFIENEANALGEDDNAAADNSIGGFPPVLEDFEVSFTLNLYADGFSVGKADELFDYTPKMLHPYDRTSEKLFSAIEWGHLPGDLFDDIPCKFSNGATLCEIRDYRNGGLHKTDDVSSSTNCPTLQKVPLRIQLSDVLNDTSSLSNQYWTEENLLKVESRILMVLQPDLRLNPNQVLDTSREVPKAKKLDLEIPWSWKKRRPSDALSEVVPNIYIDKRLNLAVQNVGPTSTHQIISSPSFNPQRHILQPFSFPSLRNDQVMCTSTLNPSCRNFYGNSVESSAFMFCNMGSCSKQADQVPFLGGGLFDFSSPSLLGTQDEAVPHLQGSGSETTPNIQESRSEYIPHLPGNQAEATLIPDGQLWSDLAKQRFEDLRFQHEDFYGSNSYSSDNDSRSQTIGQKRKVVGNYEVSRLSSGDGSTQLGCFVGDYSFPNELGHPANNISHSCSKLIEESPLEEEDPMLGRFSSIPRVTERSNNTFS